MNSLHIEREWPSKKRVAFSAVISSKNFSRFIIDCRIVACFLLRKRCEFLYSQSILLGKNGGICDCRIIVYWSNDSIHSLEPNLARKYGPWHFIRNLPTDTRSSLAGNDRYRCYPVLCCYDGAWYWILENKMNPSFSKASSSLTNWILWRAHLNEPTRRQ